MTRSGARSNELLLKGQAQQWATPMQADDGSKVTRNSKQQNLIAQSYHFSHQGPPQKSGEPSTKTLNPLFVEWLMGWPIGWTDYARPVTGLSHYRRLMRMSLSRIVSQKPKQRELF